MVKELEPLKIDCTVRLMRGVRCTAPKKHAPRAIRNLKAQAQKVMLTKDVRIDPQLNEAVWTKGVNHLPNKIRVRFNRKRNEDEDATERFYTVVELVECTNFKGLNTEVVNEDN
ncbi:60S ribosomal protein L31 [Gregarina niphandrodes]|uniref:60S ribosomal protein L31 n=1 Tax=Gregarina niphandrodes TaxID=110365 RepID=A0A023BA61_GRENI|nr:60S ribosomal protein L31 [Gregarina niphandrodes]EZG77691.1 60S ribosomal protein L31 [Gregarina niphandrodes]|eukprot:XP_011129490.1 60S ribosomal protein L31 [Gregarina niphandrodes]